MEQQPLFVESPAEALREAVRAAGGIKAVAALLWPEVRPPEAGHRRLLDCLNDERREKLSFEQVLLILRTAREAGCHVAMAYISRECGYAEPQPIEPADEAAALQRQFVAAVAEQRRLLARVERLLTPPPAGATPLRSA